MSDCTYKLTLPSGEERTIIGKAAMKAFLAGGGMDIFFPQGFKPDAAQGEDGGYAGEVAPAQPAVSDSLNKARSIDKKTVLTPSGAIKAEARNSDADSSVWYHQGDIKMLAFTASVTIDGQPAAGAERAKEIVQRVSAAQKDGWALRSYRAGSLGTVWTLEKGDRFLTRAGLENLDSSLTKDPEIPNYGPGYENMQRGQKELATALFNWLSTLTPEQRVNQGVVSRKMADVLGGWAYVEKDKIGTSVRYRPTDEAARAGSAARWTHTIPAAKDWDGVLSEIERLAGSQFAEAPSQDKPTEVKPDSKTPLIDRHTSVMDAVREGKSSPEAFKESFDAVVSGADAIKAELNGKTKAELLAGGGPYFQARYKNEAKPAVIDGIYRAMLDEYTLGESFSYGMGSYEKAVRRLVEATDADKLTRFAEERAAAIQEAAANRQAKAAAMENPQTLGDYRELLNSKIRSGMTRKEAFLTLTPEQRIQYDTLEAESTREAREARKRADATRVQTAGQATTGQVIATKHTKNGYDLFVVQLADRLSPEDYKKVLSSAKQMGGWYSSFRGNGAIPGFQFKDRANADAFLQLAQGDSSAVQAQVEQRRDAFEDDRSQTVVERLSSMADKLEAAAIEEENRDRKANTGRRARFARAALDAAAADKALAKTMRNIAQAIGDGRAKFLDQVRAKTQVDMLNQLVRTAKDNELRAKYPSYADQEKRKGEPPTAETADFAEFPNYGAFRSDLAMLGRQLLEVDGTKKLGQRLMSVADDVTDAYLAFAKANLSLVSTFGRGDSLADFASKDAAERALRKSNLTGKAIVVPVKRGQNRVVLSPSEAINRGIWQGDGDKRIMLTADFGAELVEAIGRRGTKQNKLTVPWQFQNAYDRRKALSRLGIETPSEFRSALREFIGLKEQATQNKVRELELQMVGRKADGLDFFPTASEVADQMIEAADLTPDMAVLEPSAGMGHLADRIRAAGAEPDVIEISPDRRELLEEKGYHLADVDDFMNLKPRETFTYGDVFRAPDGTEGILRGSNQNRVRLVDEDGNQLGFYNRDELTGVRHRGTESGYDRIIMNPPFSNRRDAQHVRHAYDLLKPGGRIVAIMGEGVFFGNDQKAQDFRDWLDSLGGTSEKLPEGSFMDPSLPVTTGVNARMVIIDKPDVAPGEGAADGADIAFSRRQDESPLAQEVSEAAAAMDAANEMRDAMNKAGPDSITLEDFMAVGEARMNAEKAMVNALAKAPDDGFAVEGLTEDGRMLVVTPSASEQGRWQLTRFGKDGEPWGDTRFNTKEMALKSLVEEAIPSSLRHVGVTFSRGAAGSDAGVNWVESTDQSLAALVSKAMRSDQKNKPGNYDYTIIEPARSPGSSADARTQELTDAVYRRGRDFEAAFGRRVVFVRADKGSPGFFNGFILPKSDPNTIYVNIDANVNLMSILGHEFYEGLVVTHPELHAWFVNQAVLQLNDGALRAYSDKLAALGDTQDGGGRFKELLADFTGDALADPEFRRSLEQADQNKFRQLIRAFRNFLIQTLSKMRARVTGSGLTGDKTLGSEQYFKDVQALRDVLRAVIQKANSGGSLTTYLENGGVMFSRSGDQTQTENFKRWYSGVYGKTAQRNDVGGDAGQLAPGSVGSQRSGPVDSAGNPIVFYHGTRDDITAFDINHPNRKDAGWLGRGIYGTNDPGIASDYAASKRGDGSRNVMPLYFAVTNPYVMSVEAKQKLRYAPQSYIDAFTAKMKAMGHDGAILDHGDGVLEIVAFEPTQVKSAIGNNGDFDPANPDIRYSRKFSEVKDQAVQRINQATPAATWQAPSLEDAKHRTAWDNMTYALQDKLIDTKRVVQAIQNAGRELKDQTDVYLQEELYHARVSHKSQGFVQQELTPMVKALASKGIDLPDFETYLHARHAPEANRVMKERNPNEAEIEAKKKVVYAQLQALGSMLKDEGATTKEKARVQRLFNQMAGKLELLAQVKPWTGSEEDRQKLSGMSDDEARAVMAALTPEQARNMAEVAAMFDAIVKKNRQEMVDYDLEDQDTVDGWGQMFEFYVPLMREDDGNTQGTGQGFSIKGREVKSRTGSTRKVVDIVANLAMQRERLIVRGEKNRVSQALVGLASANPNPDFWKVGAPDMERKYDPRTNSVKLVTDPNYKNKDNVVTAKLRGADGKVQEVAVVFNEDDNRAKRMAESLKNLDGQTLEGLYAAAAPITRYLASMSTQYNPVFGVVNLARDLQGAAVNLAGTPLADKKGKIAWQAKNALLDIYRAARADRKNEAHTGEWTQWWDMFQEDGGPTGYRDVFQDSAERTKAITKTMNPDAWMESAFGKVVTVNGLLKDPMRVAEKGGGFVLDWLSDYNLAMENAIRVSTYRAAVESGMTRQRAASLAKNITVNFNRKGQVGLKMGALYAFFNAAVQGTARMGKALVTMEPGKPKTMRLSPLGKKVVYGGMLMGAIQAVALAAAGFDDENPPDFVRERNTIIPIGGGKFITIPMPLGLHVFPGIGRHLTEFALSGGKEPQKRVIAMLGMMADTFNPIGNAGMSMQTLLPTVLDPLAALMENKDYAGRPIARTSMDPNVPGHELTRTTATWISQGVSELINWATGGDKYVAGVFSPTPDQIDYLVGQATGGVGRELLKLTQTGQALTTGEELPMHKVPLLGRFVGTANGSASQSGPFYAKVTEAKRLDRRIDGLREDGDTAKAMELQRSNAYLLAKARVADSQVTRLRREKRQLLENGAPRAQVQEVERRMSEAMRRFNEATAK